MSEDLEPLPLLGIKPEIKFYDNLEVWHVFWGHRRKTFVEMASGSFSKKTKAIQAWNEFVEQVRGPRFWETLGDYRDNPEIRNHPVIHAYDRRIAELSISLDEKEQHLAAQYARIKELESKLAEHDTIGKLAESAQEWARQEYEPQDPNTEALARATRLAGQSR